MAEAAPPRKTTTYNRFSTMASQNERYNTKEDEFFWLENIMRTAPHKLHSVPGPRTVASFPIAQPCLPDAPRDHQSIAQIACTNIQTGFPPGSISSNSRASWGFIDNGIVIAAVVSSDGSQMQVIQADVSTGTVIGTLTPIPTPFFGTILLNGQSDEQSYAFFGGVGGGDQNMWYFSWPNQRVTKFVQNYPGYLLTGGPLWAKHGDLFYSVIQWGFGSSPVSFVSVQQFSFTGVPNGDGTFQGTFIQDNITTLTQPTSSDPTVTPVSVQATADFVYVMVLKPQAGTNPSQLYKFNVSDLTLADMFQFDYLTSTNPTNNAAAGLIYAVSDDLAYVTRTSNLDFSGTDNALEFGYVDWNTHSYEYIDRVPVSTLTCASAGPRSANLVFQNGAFYYGSSANDVTGGSIDIAKIGPVSCPNLFHGGLMLSRLDFQFPDAAVAGLVSWAEFQVPDTNVGLSSYASFRAAMTDEAGLISYSAFEVGQTIITKEIIVKPSDSSFTTTPSNDPDLTFPIAAGQTWVIHFMLVVTDDFANVGLSVPPAATGNMVSPNFYEVQGLTPGGGITLPNFPEAVFIVATVVNGANAGNVTLQIAAQTTTATLKQFSSLTAYRVG